MNRDQKKPVTYKIGNEQSRISLRDIPSCQVCGLTEQKARCDVYQSEKQKCQLIICKKCQQKYPDRICDQLLTGCRKKVRQHRLKNRFKDKIKNTINTRFQNQSKLRKKYLLEQYKVIDQDMAHILAALLSQNYVSFYSNYQKDIDKLVEQLKNNQYTIQSKIDRNDMPVYKSTVICQDISNDGKIACGYQMENFSKGINQIFQCIKKE